MDGASTQGSKAMSSALQVMVALNFFATGAVLDSTATIDGVERMSATRCIHRIVQVLEEIHFRVNGK